MGTNRLWACRWLPALAILACCLTATPARSQQSSPAKVTSPPQALKLAPFYKKYVDANGLPVVSSEKVPDQALLTAVDVVNHMLEKRPDVRKALIEAKVRIAVMAKTELTTQIPEHSDLQPKAYWDKRARGLGATAWRPACSCAEENLLGYKDDPYRGESILIHEFGHTIHEMGVNAIDKTFDARLQRTYQQAMKKGLWKNTYDAQDYREYWAEGVQCYFDADNKAIPANGIHNQVSTRTELEKYDPDLAALIAEVFHNDAWRWPRIGAHK